MSGLVRAGQALRELRERRRLTLEAAASLTAGYREPLNKSYLHRLEAGQVSPSVSRLSALASAYGVPTPVLVELFDTEERLAAVDVSVAGASPRELLDRVVELIASSHYLEALALAREFSAWKEQQEIPGDVQVRLLQCRVDCLLHLGAHESAKSEALRLLERPGLTPTARVNVLSLAAAACSSLKLFTAAFAFLDQADAISKSGDVESRAMACLKALRGLTSEHAGHHERAADAFGEAIRDFDSLSDTLEACRARINLTSALISLGRLDEATSHLQSALAAAQSSRHLRLVCLALSNLALTRFQQGGLADARTAAQRSNELAREIGYPEVMFRNTFYLAEIARRSGDEMLALTYERALRRLYNDVDPDSPEAATVRKRMVDGEARETKGGGE